MPTPPNDTWAAGELYEPYVGRWSRLAADLLLDRLAAPAGLDWLDVGCGTGALSSAILERASPRSLTGVDASPGFLAYARRRLPDARVRFEVADARQLPFDDARFDACVSALMLNFVPEPGKALREMARVTRPGATVALYVWDYPGGMTLMRAFWDAAVALDPDAAERHESRRFTWCEPGALARLSAEAGLQGVSVQPLDVHARFRDFDDYWQPFLGGQGPAPSYLLSLPPAGREALERRLSESLRREPDGSIELLARAWAVLSTAPSGRASA